MTKLMRSLVMAMIVIAISFPANSAPDAKIKFGMEGTTWKLFDDDPDSSVKKLYKISILKGVLDGLMFGKSPIMKDIYTDTSYNHIIRSLDQFYSDYKNEKILIVWALEIISMEIRGEDKEKIEDKTKTMRRLTGSRSNN